MWAQRVDSIDELSVARRLRAQPGFAWLDSNRTEARDGRYSFLGAWPTDEIRVEFGDDAPFSTMRRAGGRAGAVGLKGPRPCEVPSWIGYIAYDAFWSAPVRGRPRFDRHRDAIVLFKRYPALLAVDHQDGGAWVVGDDRAACDAFWNALRGLRTPKASPASVGPVEVDDAAGHQKAIQRALEYIARGDVYEVNVARRWSATFEGDPLDLWRGMRAASRVPLGMFLDAGDHHVLACTMERFIHWDAQSRTLVTRPIKGTVRREPTDDGAAQRLRADPKEQAEHSMIVDLMRNDLGRVAEIGTVKVDAPLVVEPFTGLYHLVSTVSCTTRPDVTIDAVLEATFPPGSVTGAPKIRALEIIEELEKHPRGIYCGAVGFVDHDGGLSLAVAIRTATVAKGRVCYWAGGGIVEASDPAREVAETELKARVFLDAIESLTGGGISVNDRIDDVLELWFGKLDELGRASPSHRKRWWAKSDAFDEAIKSQFLGDYEAIVAGEREAWRNTARGALAYIIVLDQFSRNMFRGTAMMFSADELARGVCYEGLDAALDAELAFDERVFFYLPLEHSERMVDQHRCLELFSSLVDTAPEPLKADAEYYLDFARRHKAIIDRFGRYPHRNEVLGRKSTPEEVEFLNRPGSSF